MMLKEHAMVILNEDVPNKGLKAGDMGVIVHVHKGGEAYEVEFMKASGSTIAVVTLTAKSVSPTSEDYVMHARKLAA
jgi:ATP-dependent exoDNAse (exonuclease V) alpha subunit